MTGDCSYAPLSYCDHGPVLPPSPLLMSDDVLTHQGFAEQTSDKKAQVIIFSYFSAQIYVFVDDAKRSQTWFIFAKLLI